ncbi:hypothetical protein EST38_g5514 [Candolleomyces aberdarensis]|uniref:Uncharacterized protein n=1 Tax=Candolleomyces aberdarensis TaxID=2316362 RepID=A0A4Q2DJV3_9AGAR|nr:hypothetical protein EST38_g5514 [Candolleomyces aberdarensis]
MSYLSTLDHWSRSRLSGDETPLLLIAERISTGPSSRYTLQRSAEYRGLWQLWDTDSDSAVVATHAFVIDFASDLKSGNFVPDGEKPPNDMLDYQCKREPGLQAQISLAFDTREDMSVYRCVKNCHCQAIEDWLFKVPDFNTLKKPRSSWMSPKKDNEANHHRYIVNSSLFQKRTAFNCSDGKYTVGYEVHPWVERNCVPHNRSWIPNPSLVSVMDRLTGPLLDIRDIAESDLDQGDIVKMKFKVTFSVTRSNWLTTLVPIQVVRVGRVDATAPQNSTHSGDHEGVVLLKPGTKLTLVPELTNQKTEKRKRDSPDWGDVKEEEEDYAYVTASQAVKAQESDLTDEDGAVRVIAATNSENKGKRKATDDGDKRKRNIKARR